MDKKRYWKQRFPLLLLHFLCMTGLFLFLWGNGNEADGIFLILVVWILLLAGYLGKEYGERKAQLNELLKVTEQLEERYLITEVMDRPEREEDLVYYRVLKMADKSMLEQIEKVRRERKEYKEYIEQWIHEIKTPITAMKLLCENHRADVNPEMFSQLEKTNHLIEQVLYYARSDDTQKDYSVREIRLFDTVHQAIADNKYLLLQCHVKIDIQETEDTVYADEKWVCFILNQLIVNAVQYRTAQPVLGFSCKRQGNQVFLYVRDNGIGIDAADLPRIFEKGFTGRNGREASRNATGIGLYLCRRLCDKLGIGLSVTSGETGTVFEMAFHANVW